MDGIIFVPLGTGMASISLPSIPLIGTPRGKMMSCRVLCQVRKGVRENVQGHELTL